MRFYGNNLIGYYDHYDIRCLSSYPMTVNQLHAKNTLLYLRNLYMNYESLESLYYIIQSYKRCLKYLVLKKNVISSKKKTGTIKPSLNPPLNQTSPPLNPQKKPIKPRYQLSPPHFDPPLQNLSSARCSWSSSCCSCKVEGAPGPFNFRPTIFFFTRSLLFFLLVVCFWGFLTKRFLVQECFLAKFCCWSNISRFKKKHRIMYRLIFMEGHFSVAWKKNTIFSSQLNSLRKIRSNEIGHPQPLCTDTNWSRSAC